MQREVGKVLNFQNSIAWKESQCVIVHNTVRRFPCSTVTSHVYTQTETSLVPTNCRTNSEAKSPDDRFSTARTFTRMLVLQQRVWLRLARTLARFLLCMPDWIQDITGQQGIVAQHRFRMEGVAPAMPSDTFGEHWTVVSANLIQSLFAHIYHLLCYIC